jgi:hypothetical protein
MAYQRRNMYQASIGMASINSISEAKISVEACISESSERNGRGRRNQKSISGIGKHQLSGSNLEENDTEENISGEMKK